MSVSSRDSSLVLIIDDSSSTIHLLGSILGDQAQLLFASDGPSGLRLAVQELPDLILLDVEMPHMDGYAVCRALLADPRTRDCAIIIMTAHTNRESEVAALDAGAVDFITKPFNPPVVQARVRTQLRLQKQSAELNRLVNRDSLTGLYNRRHFDLALAAEFERHRRQQLSLAIALIDVDYFKAFNDNYGHPEGDRCLQKIGQAIGAAARRPGETAARLGGEEFALLIPGHTAEKALIQGERLCASMENLLIPHLHSAVKNIVTISVGVAACVPGAHDVSQLLIDTADRALYRAKSEGRNRAVIADSE
jgi:diguanylate cyclase (GGDEF)-like protein